jgi:tRNA(adenine34) deaminase
MNDMDYMAEALKEAALAGAAGELPVGCVVVRGGEIVAQAHNECEARRDATAHAELLAIQRASATTGGWRLNDCALYVTLEPCPMCAGAMVMSRLGKCVWGAADPEKGCCGSVYDLPADPALGAVCSWEQAADAEECRRLLQDCFQKRRTER